MCISLYSFLLAKNFLLLGGVHSRYQTRDQVERQPREEGYPHNFKEESPGYVRSVEIRSKEHNAENIASEGEQNTHNHFPVGFNDDREHVEQLGNNQRRECDSHYIREALVEEIETAKHDHAALENGLPHPDKEGLGGEGPTFLEGLVERGEFHDCRDGHVLI